MTPTDWNMMSISDNNLCTLLDMSRTTHSTRTLLTQLPLLLHSNLLQASSLDEVIASCNAGLPVDAFGEYSRSKKPALANSAYLGKDANSAVSEERDVPLTRGCGRMAGSPSPSLAAPPPCHAPSPSSAAALGGQGLSGQSTTDALKKILSKSPHIIMCCPNTGSISYILTMPTAEANAPTQALPRILPSPSPSTERGRGSLTFGGGGGGGGLLPGSPKVTKNRRIAMKGKEKAVDGGGDKTMLESIQRAINGIINPQPTQTPAREGVTRGQSSQNGSTVGNRYSSAATPTFVSSSTRSTTTPVPPSSSRNHAQNHTPSLHSHASHDYDPEKFSKFADFLVKMDPIEMSGFPDDDPVTSKGASRTSSMESEPMDSSGSDPISSTPPLEGTEPRPLPNEQGQGERRGEAPTTTTTTTGHSGGDEDSMSWLFSDPPPPPDPVTDNDGKTDHHHHHHGMNFDPSNFDPSALGSRGNDDDDDVMENSGHEMEDSGTTTTLIAEGSSCGGGSGGMDFNLELDAESWKEFLQSSPCRTPHHHHHHHGMHSDLAEGDFPQIDHLVESFSSAPPPPHSEAMRHLDKPIGAAGGPFSMDTAVSGIHGVQPSTTAGATESVSWNGLWQNCNPDSIKNWLQSTIPLGEGIDEVHTLVEPLNADTLKSGHLVLIRTLCFVPV